MATLELPRLLSEHQDSLNNNIDITELALSNMKLGKSPGMDGLTLEFYQTFKNELLPHFLDLFEYCLSQAEVPTSWKEGRIAVFSKKGKDAYRSISILNADYKSLLQF